MRPLLAAFLMAASLAPAFAANQSGEPRYFVKAWLQKADKSFEHATGWCDGNDLCLLPIAEHMIELREVSGDSYLLSFKSAPPEPKPCCIFRDGSFQIWLRSGSPRVAVLFYPPYKRGEVRVTQFGRLIIAVEVLNKPNPVTPALRL
ncbi:hypothetical protein [Sinorhizobium fredii]|uniref:Uncharacterized protein n=2 Tax=Rhizobium fredii TaxID=380 RepID=A0A2A6LR79_RHIFR|nr:hypothetical protein [Sinorhizobium fredii]ASY69338.1 hypothetical protein SF83666_c19210 [Sinorhizobium fredii CCBAU 83666]KSV90968.1 hypothetical protein N181_09945 [Sinorhizobium fredii USDA 205]MQW99429.1 hypothetical protein [Sinorhizobium fredii]MQX08625.1 hypothetical protein [Sinorhizobium fredii]PDT44629.1 hypothetical protein CO661_28265 [Sinorhizobium fredii]